MDYTQIIVGFVSALIYTIGGFLKTQPVEEFNEWKLIRTLIYGVIVGFIVALFNIPIDSAFSLFLTYGAQTGFVALIDFYSKAIWRRWLYPILHPEGSETPTPTS